MVRRDFGVAFGLPEPYTSELQGWRERLGDPNAAGIPPHVTLLPPTALEEAQIEEVEEHLRQVAAGERSFRMRLRGSGSFRPVSPVVFVPLVEGMADCARIERKIRVGPLARTLSFPYHPHVTVAHDVDKDSLDKAFSTLSAYDCSFEVAAFCRYEHGTDGVWRPQRGFGLSG